MNLSRRFLWTWSILLLLGSLLGACGTKPAGETKSGFIFNPVDTSYVATGLQVPGGKFKYVILYTEGQEERVEWKNILSPAKGKQSFLAYLPIKGSPTHGILWTNHETTLAHDPIGDGGGATVMEVFRDSINGWMLVGVPYSVNFDKIGGTIANSLGCATPWGTLLISERIEDYTYAAHTPASGDSLSQPTNADTSAAAVHRRASSTGWMVEVDPYKREGLGKRHAMGRFMHEGVLAMPDARTFYLLDGEGPSAFFKFVADTAQNLNSGQLFAYCHQVDSMGRHWQALPRGRDSLMYARKFAFQKGATIFNRLEDIKLLPDGSFLISESGKDSSDLGLAIAQGGKIGPHLERLHLGKNVYDDKYGRILRFDPQAEIFSVYLEGGQALEEKSIFLSNPGNLAIDTERKLLVIQEAMIGSSAGRIPASTGILADAEPGKPRRLKVCNEIYFLDLSIAQPKLDDLKRFAVIPAGFEATGAIFSPDFKSLFFNLKMIDKGGVAPFDRSMTVVVSGFGE